jgi:hypothetical protein
MLIATMKRLSRTPSMALTNLSGRFTTSMHLTATKPSSDNDKFHDALEQFADDPDSIIDLVVYRANHARYVCDHETVEAAPKLVMTSEPDYGQLRPHLSWLSIDAIKKTFKCTTQLACMHAHEYYTQEMIQVSESCLEHAST